MRQLAPTMIALLTLVACGGAQPSSSIPASPAIETQSGLAQSSEADPPSEPAAEAIDDATAEGTPPGPSEFKVDNSDSAKRAQPAKASKIKPSKTEAALKLFVLDKDKGPIAGVVISLTAPDGKKYYTEETDAEGYAEVLVPVGQKYELVYLSLGRRDINANVPVSDEPNQNINLRLRYKRFEPPPGTSGGKRVAPGFVLDGVTFDTGKATIRGESFPRLDGVVEYMARKRSTRIQISGHTDNVGNPKTNKILSEKRALACRDYLVSKGIDKSRIEAVGFGDERPIAPNENEAARQKNRRIEATEL